VRCGSSPGTTVVVVVRYLGLWWINACRIVRVVSNELEGWGFSYGTFLAHAESGEESFMVAIQPSDGLVTYHLRAASRPRALVARLGYPLTRALQARFRRDSAAAMKRAVMGSGPRSPADDGVGERPATPLAPSSTSDTV
jgi:uncharacterized protein (UPF0548 family)